MYRATEAGFAYGVNTPEYPLVYVTAVRNEQVVLEPDGRRYCYEQTVSVRWPRLLVAAQVEQDEAHSLATTSLIRKTAHMLNEPSTSMRVKQMRRVQRLTHAWWEHAAMLALANDVDEEYGVNILWPGIRAASNALDRDQVLYEVVVETKVKKARSTT